ncbi:MAG: hypothetical protein QG553_277 [Patescibacteria group bacterium]|nr:hypothetical protein [Patescibacteria group bacterium]
MAIGIITVLIGAGVIYLLTSSEPEKAMEQVTQQSTTAATTPPVTNDSKPGAYIDYSSAAISQTSGTKLLFFHAPWCPQCRDLEASIKQDGVPNGVTIIKVDYDSNQALRQKYGVTLQTTVVKIDDKGNLVDKFVAYQDPSLNAIKQQLL